MKPSRMLTGDEPNHSAIDRPWEYQITGVSFHVDPSNQTKAKLEMSLARGEQLVLLRFDGVSDLEIQAGFPWSDSTIQILDLSSRGMEDARVRVCGIEGHDTGIRFWAKSVERADT
jgi:hypothetical protein